MARETEIQSQVESYQRLKKEKKGTWFLLAQHYEVWIKGKYNNPQ